MLLGALEAGGTKMVCAIGNEKGEIWDQVSIPTEIPAITMPKLIAYFREKEIEALGIGSFGPIDPDRQSSTYGYITSTPKLSWANYNIVGEFKQSLHCPVEFDTDVNSSVLGEVTFGSARGKDSVLYLTVGTGIGAGIYVEGNLLHGMLHPEAGHILLRKREDDNYQGKCPYHDSCFEGLASGPSIEERWGQRGEFLSDREEVWDLEAYYIGQALTDYILTISPQMIILGGGVMKQTSLYPKIRGYVTAFLNGYIKTDELKDMERYIVPASLGGNQGIMGCLALARQAADEGLR